MLIDTNGNIVVNGDITAKTINADKINLKDTGDFATTGKAVIFATPDTLPIAVSKKKIDKKTFELRIEKPVSQDVEIDWWILN